MLPPKVDIDVKCVKCKERIMEDKYTGSWIRKKTREECVLLRCPNCKKLLAIPLESKKECYLVRNVMRDFTVVMH